MANLFFVDARGVHFLDCQLPNLAKCRLTIIINQKIEDLNILAGKVSQLDVRP